MTLLDWQNYNDIQHQLSIVEKNWLFDRNSLTKRLTHLSRNKFSLEVLSEKTHFLRKDECQVLNMPYPKSEWVREVLLKGNNVPWVYARSVILCDNIHHENVLLSHRKIGKTPLGSVLFDKEKFDRSDIEITTYPKKLLPFEYACLKLWARRSSFKKNMQHILVQEIFLPDFWAQLDDG